MTDLNNTTARGMNVAELDDSSDEHLVRRVWWRVAPLLMLVYLISVIDKQNVGFAKLQMVSSLGISERAYGFASSLFFLGYVMFEMPSALAVHRFGAPKWFARIMLTWGIATLLLAISSSNLSFSILRFLVGAAEAGLYPGIIYYFTLWFPKPYQIRALSVLTIGSALGNMLGSVLGGYLLSMNDLLQLAGWQWVFIATGLPAIILAPIIWKCLPSRPEQANFLTPSERIRLATLVVPDAQLVSHGSPFRVLLDRRVLLFALIDGLLLTALYSVVYWLPTIIHHTGATNKVNGVLNMLPWIFAIILLVVVPKYLKSESAVMHAMAGFGAISAVAFGTALLTTSPTLGYIAIVIGTPCISVMFTGFWTLPARHFKGAHAAAAFAAVGMIGTLGGFAAQNIMPWLGQIFGNPSAALLLPALCMLGVALGFGVAVFRMKAAIPKQNYGRQT